MLIKEGKISTGRKGWSCLNETEKLMINLHSIFVSRRWLCWNPNTDLILKSNSCTKELRCFRCQIDDLFNHLSLRYTWGTTLSSAIVWKKWTFTSKFNRIKFKFYMINIITLLTLYIYTLKGKDFTVDTFSISADGKRIAFGAMKQNILLICSFEN